MMMSRLIRNRLSSRWLKSVNRNPFWSFLHVQMPWMLLSVCKREMFHLVLIDQLRFLLQILSSTLGMRSWPRYK